MPFPRLIRALDEWAGERGRRDVFAQIGPTADRPRHIAWTHFMPPNDFRAKMNEATAVVAHAGMGTIISALCARKPIIIMPRRGDLMETRNDHQKATAGRFAAMRGVGVAADREALFSQLDRLDDLAAPLGISDIASQELLFTIRSFILGEAAEHIRYSAEAAAR